MSHTIIVGAGIAGLTAAYYLQKAERDYTILEASDRIGGRIKTDEYNGFLMPYLFSQNIETLILYS